MDMMREDGTVLVRPGDVVANFVYVEDGTWNPEPVLSYAGIARTYNTLADQLLAFSHS